MGPKEIQEREAYMVNYKITNDAADNSEVERSEGLLGIFPTKELAVKAVRDQYELFLMNYEDEPDYDYYQHTDPFGDWEDECYAEWHYGYELELPWWHIEFFIEKTMFNTILKTIRWADPVD